MTSPVATITDGTTTIDFVGNPDLRPFIHPVGAAYNPLGYTKTVMSVDVAREGVTATMVAIPSTASNDAALKAMLKEMVPLTITYPDDSTITVGVDPATDPISSLQFSTYLWQYVNTWTVKFFEVDEA